MEGPSAHTLADDLERLRGQTVEAVRGNAKQPLEDLEGRTVTRIEAIKKRVVVGDDEVAAVVHFLMYGTYRWNERRDDQPVRLGLVCSEDEWNTYNTSAKVWTAERIAEELDPSGDVLRDEFDAQRARDALAHREDPVADVLLDQDVFGGVGNIVKNEALWQAGVHPRSPAASLDEAARNRVFEETMAFTRDWYERGSAAPPDGSLDIYRSGECPSCGSEVTKADVGERDRVTYWCPVCQPAGDPP